MIVCATSSGVTSGCAGWSRAWAAELIARMQAFMRDHVLPAEPGYADELAGGADRRR